ncbi:MAG: glutamine--tRNA ligase, partial [Pseudomonadota bacterium]|nr:glutamine--tRNA ligase [Pseudomonadota bacterium]
AATAEVRLYEPLFREREPEAGEELAQALNPASLTVLRGCMLEPSLGSWPEDEPLQFERHGYFCPDPDGKPGKPVFNRTVALRDSWAKEKVKG